jgi:hypothetical protein
MASPLWPLPALIIKKKPLKVNLEIHSSPEIICTFPSKLSEEQRGAACRLLLQTIQMFIVTGK